MRNDPSPDVLTLAYVEKLILGAIEKVDTRGIRQRADRFPVELSWNGSFHGSLYAPVEPLFPFLGPHRLHEIKSRQGVRHRPVPMLAGESVSLDEACQIVMDKLGVQLSGKGNRAQAPGGVSPVDSFELIPYEAVIGECIVRHEYGTMEQIIHPVGHFSEQRSLGELGRGYSGDRFDDRFDFALGV